MKSTGLTPLLDKHTCSTEEEYNRYMYEEEEEPVLCTIYSMPSATCMVSLRTMASNCARYWTW